MGNYPQKKKYKPYRHLCGVDVWVRYNKQDCCYLFIKDIGEVVKKFTSHCQGCGAWLAQTDVGTLLKPVNE